MFRPRHPFPRPDLCCLSSCGPLGSRLSLIPTTLPAHTGTLLRRERLPLPPVTSHQSQITKSFTIRTSKTLNLKLFRMNTYEKTGEGVGAQVSSRLDHFPFPKIVIPSKARDLLFRGQAPALFPPLTTHYHYPLRTYRATVLRKG